MRISDWSSDVCSSDLGPTPHQPPGLIIEMRQLDLEPPFGGRRALAEAFEDQPGAVDHLGLERGFEVALLDRRQRGIEDDANGFLHSPGRSKRLHLAAAEKARDRKTDE